MEILLIIILLISVGINVFMFIKQTKKTKETEKVDKKPKLTKEEEKKQKEIREAFDNLMNYDETIARRRR